MQQRWVRSNAKGPLIGPNQRKAKRALTPPVAAAERSVWLWVETVARRPFKVRYAVDWGRIMRMPG